MTEVIPFKGILYDTSRVKVDDVVSPPYDIISPKLKDILYLKSPYNIIRIDFGKDYDGDNNSDNRYTRACEYLNDWLVKGILKETERELFYLNEVEYSIAGTKKVMRGLFVRVKLRELCDGIYPHEATYSKPKTDRLNLLRFCCANLSPIFSIFNSPKRKYLDIFREVSSTYPYLVAKDTDDAVHRMWIIDEYDDIEVIKKELKGIAIYIADGHHRYETALTYQKEMREKNPSHTGNEPYNYVMMYLVNIADGGLTILPTHRLIRHIPFEGKRENLSSHILKSLEKLFEIRTIDDRCNIISEIAGLKHAIGLSIHGSQSNFLLIPRVKEFADIPEALRGLDVIVLDKLILKKLLKVNNIEYEMDSDTALNKVRGGTYQASFFLNPTEVYNVEKISLSCLRMPPKSTYFFPKILTGFVINRLE